MHISKSVLRYFLLFIHTTYTSLLYTTITNNISLSPSAGKMITKGGPNFSNFIFLPLSCWLFAVLTQFTWNMFLAVFMWNQESKRSERVRGRERACMWREGKLSNKTIEKKNLHTFQAIWGRRKAEKEKSEGKRKKVVFYPNDFIQNNKNKKK